MKEEDMKLLHCAKEAMTNAYAPYSSFQVGAALLTEDGQVYKGCNVENASYGASCCAERVALFSAVACGEKKFKAIAIVSSGKDFTFPCGICRQVLSEFLPDGYIVLENAEGEIQKFTVAELLPHAFQL